jgi:hypothetical protein
MHVRAGAHNRYGTTRITNGAYRVHPVEWSIGEAAGSLAAFAPARSQQGVLLAWPQFGPLTPGLRVGYQFAR